LKNGLKETGDEQDIILDRSIRIKKELF